MVKKYAIIRPNSIVIFSNFFNVIKKCKEYNDVDRVEEREYQECGTVEKRDITRKVDAILGGVE